MRFEDKILRSEDELQVVPACHEGRGKTQAFVLIFFRLALRQIWSTCVRVFQKSKLNWTLSLHERMLNAVILQIYPRR